MRRILVLGAAAFLSLALVGPVAAANPGSSGEHAPVYYLALGDSLAAGVQPIGSPDQMYRTNEGYANQLYTAATAWYPNLRLVNLACPGESTTTMIAGGICYYEDGSQLAEAVEFIHAHAAFVAFVTIDLGPNDFACQNDVSCLPAGLASISQNLPVILSELRAAAPNVPMFGMTIFDPLLGYWLTGPAGQDLAIQSVGGFEFLNGTLSAIYGAAGIEVADVQGAFSTTNFAMVSVPGLGTVPLNVAKICQWTWVCAPPPLGPNNHPNVTGYGVIAQAFAAVINQ